MTSAADEVAALYDATYRRLVGQLTLATGSGADAEECVQEAFARLLVRWDKIGHYDQPEAWVRLVAFRLAANRRRRVVNEAKAVLRLRRTRETAALHDPAERGVVESMRSLSPHHRAVLVMHYVIGLDVAEIADILNLPEGTVKSRLARPRAIALDARPGGNPWMNSDWPCVMLRKPLSSRHIRILPRS